MKRILRAEFFHQVAIAFHVVCALHHAKNAIVARLHGQVQILHHLVAADDRLDVAVAARFRVAGRVANPPQLVDFIQRRKQIREVLARRRHVAVHILSQQHDLAVALRHHATHFIDNLRQRTAPFLPARFRNDAVGAGIIAAIHDVHEALQFLLANGN